MKPDELAERLLEFAARSGKVADAPPETRLGRHVAEQLVRCKTAPSPNQEEGRADLVHKLRSCVKETSRTAWPRTLLRVSVDREQNDRRICLQMELPLSHERTSSLPHTGYFGFFGREEWNWAAHHLIIGIR